MSNVTEKEVGMYSYHSVSELKALLTKYEHKAIPGNSGPYPPEKYLHYIDICKETLRRYYVNCSPWVILKVSKARYDREEIKRYLGFGAEFLEDSNDIRIPKEHADWLINRLSSGLIGTEIVREETIS